MHNNDLELTGMAVHWRIKVARCRARAFTTCRIHVCGEAISQVLCSTAVPSFVVAVAFSLSTTRSPLSQVLAGATYLTQPRNQRGPQQGQLQDLPSLPRHHPHCSGHAPPVPRPPTLRPPQQHSSPVPGVALLPLLLLLWLPLVLLSVTMPLLLLRGQMHPAAQRSSPEHAPP